MPGIFNKFTPTAELEKKAAIDYLNGNISMAHLPLAGQKQPVITDVTRIPFSANVTDVVARSSIPGPGREYFKDGFALPVPRFVISTRDANSVPVERRVKIELERTDLWQEFHKYTTEMVVTKPGRRMFPTLRFRVAGLDEVATYGFYMVFFPVDNYRYKFQHGKWCVCGRGDGPMLSPSDATYQHPDSPAPGRTWMSQPVSFHRIKLTNSAKTHGDMVVLNSMRKYQPRLVIVKLHENYNGQPLQIVAEFAPPEIEFMAVTAYQNNYITKLKVKHNPFAKGFRQNVVFSPMLDPAREEDSKSQFVRLERKRKLAEVSIDGSDEKMGQDGDQQYIPRDTPIAADLTIFPNARRNPGPIWPVISPPTYYLAAEMTRAAAAATASASASTNSGFHIHCQAAPTVVRSMIPPFYASLRSSLVQPPSSSSYNGFSNPLTAPSVNLPQIDTVWPRFPSNVPGSYYGANAGVRFTMY